MEVISSNTMKVSSWSGGETTEIFIYPTTGNYQQGEYELRISTATVTEEKTIYTRLPGVSRTLTVMEGHLILNHKGQHSVHLSPLEQDIFSGEWETHSTGIVKNFNVMTKSGKSKTLPIEGQKNSRFSLENNNTVDVLYLVNGSIQLEGTQLYQGDAVLLKEDTEINFLEESKLLKVEWLRG